MGNTNDSKEKTKAVYKNFVDIEQKINIEENLNNVEEDIEYIKSRIEKTMQDYAIGMKNESISRTYQQNMRNKIFCDIERLDKIYQIFRSKSYKAASSIGKYKKNICFSNVAPVEFFLYVNKVMNEIVTKYKKENKIGSFIYFFGMYYLENMREAMLEDKALKKENNDNKISYIKKLTRKALIEFFGKDKKFLSDIKEILNKKDKEYFNYSKLKKFFVECIIKYVTITISNKKVDKQKIYEHINKLIEKNIPLLEQEYVFDSRRIIDLKEAKECLYKVIDKLYNKDEYSNENDIMDNNIKDSKYFKDMISELENINIDNLTIILDKMSKIEEFLLKINKLFKDSFVISDIQQNDDEEFSMIDRYNVNNNDFKEARSIFIACMDICEETPLSKSEREIASYMYQYVILDFLRRGHNDLIIKEYSDKYIKKEFKEFYNEEISIKENPNYIGDKVGIRTNPPIKKIERKALECITKFLGIQYDTVRKTKRKIEYKMNKTIEEKAKLKCARRLMEYNN